MKMNKVAPLSVTAEISFLEILTLFGFVLYVALAIGEELVRSVSEFTFFLEGTIAKFDILFTKL